MTASITASMLYSLVTCPHRVTMDLYADPALRDYLATCLSFLETQAPRGNGAVATPRVIDAPGQH